MRRTLRWNGWTATAVLACAALAACVPPPEPTPAPAPAPVPAPAPTPTPPPAPPPFAGNWMDAPLTPGDWTYTSGVASFGTPGGGPRLTLRCDRVAGLVAIGYFGTPGERAAMTIRTETLDRTVADTLVTTSDPRGSAPITGRVPARDPLLDAMAFSKGRFAIEVAGLPTLYVPSFPEVTRVVEDCR